MLESLPGQGVAVSGHFPGDRPVNPVEVRHLLPEEEDPLFLQRGLDLGQPHQGPRHLQVRRQLCETMTGYLVCLLRDPGTTPLHPLHGPRQHVAYQVLPVEP